MAKIKVISERPLYDGMAITFNAPCECSAVDGLLVCYNDVPCEFTFRDAHGNDLAGLGNLFAEGALVKVILNTENNRAFIQNADTNAYLEAQLANKAPAGYGYGDYLYIGAEPGYLLSEKIDAEIKSWDHKTIKQCALYEADFYTFTIIATICKFNDNYTVINGITANGYQLIRKKIGNTWYEWEWVNPPMESGVEYRTTERFEGKPVYAKRINFGSISTDVTFKSVGIGSSVDRLVRIEGYWTTGDSKHPFSSAFFVLQCFVQLNNTLTVTGDIDMMVSGYTYTGYPVLYYTKSE